MCSSRTKLLVICNAHRVRGVHTTRSPSVMPGHACPRPIRVSVADARRVTLGDGHERTNRIAVAASQ